jgi:hypothetical protein
MIKLRKLLREDVDDYEIEDLEGKDAILQYLQAHGKDPEVVKLGNDEYIIWDDNIIDPEYPRVKSKNDWVYSMEGNRLVNTLTGAIEDKFNTEFWENPQVLFHATPTENVEDIKVNGLKSQHKSRGMANRHIRGAVFTSTEPDWITHSYGPSVITINTRLMKQDGFMPYVTKEPNHTESDVINFLLRKIKASERELDRDYSNARSEGTTDDTVIIHSAVPAKYLSFELV